MGACRLADPAMREQVVDSGGSPPGSAQTHTPLWRLEPKVLRITRPALQDVVDEEVLLRLAPGTGPGRSAVF